MDESISRAIAYVAYRVVTRKKASIVRDANSGAVYQLTGNVTPYHVSVTDLSAGAALTGDGTRSILRLHHSASGAHIRLEVRGPEFAGYEGSSGSHFTGSVKGTVAVVIRDLSHSSVSRFSVQ